MSDADTKLLTRIPWFIGRVIKYFGVDDGYDPKKQADLVNASSEDYNKIGLSAATFAKDAIEDYANDHASMISLFENPDDKSALALTDQYIADTEKSAKEIKKLNDDLHNQHYSPEDLYKTWERLRKSQVDAVEKQQKVEVSNISNLYQHDDALKEEKLNKLKAEHTKQLDAVKQTTAESLKIVQKLVEQEHLIFLILKNAQKNNSSHPEIVEQIQRIIEGPNNHDRLAQLNSIQGLKTASGLEIKRNGNNGISIDIPANWNLRYHQSLTEHEKADLRELVQRIKGEGHETIRLDINGADQETQMYLIKEAFKAARDGGFPPENIEIYADGRKIKAEDLPQSYFPREPLTKPAFANMKADDAKQREIKDKLEGQGPNIQVREDQPEIRVR